MRTRFLLTSLVFFVAITGVSAAVNCTIATDNPDSTVYTAVENVTTQGHYDGGTIYELYCSKNWYYENGNVSFRYVDPSGNGGHVQDPSVDTYPEEERFGRGISCTYRTGSCQASQQEICAFAMSSEDNAHIADCTNTTVPHDNEYDGRLCCEVQEICTDGIDNDGDGLVDCADPECNAATGPGPKADSPQVCNPPSCPATLHEGLHGFYQFEGNLADSSGSENELAVAAGSADYTNQYSGRRGTATRVDLDQDKLRSPEPVLGGFDSDGSSMTVMAWVRATSVSGTQTLVDVQDGSGGDAHRIVWDEASSSAAFETPAGSLTGSASKDEWVHVAGVVDNDSGLTRLYVDGVEADSLAATSSWGEAYVSVGDEYNDGSTSNGGEAVIDQVRVYDRALSVSEIASFGDPACNNRQRTVECVNSPELCETEYASSNNYHCSYGKYDDPQNTDYEDAPPGSQGTGVCCPRDQDAQYDSLAGEWTCTGSNECGISGTVPCNYNISSSEDAWFASKSDGESNACNSQVPNLNVDTGEQEPPEDRSQACCYVPKDGREGFFYKDGNVKVYG